MKKKITQLIDHYIQTIATNTTIEIESADASDNNLFSPAQNERIVEDTVSGLRHIGENNKMNATVLEKIQNRIIKKGPSLLTALHQRNHIYFRDNPDDLELLEVIVRTDGSRPAFLIRNGIPDLESSSPAAIVSKWSSIINTSKERLKTPIDCVGRIDLDGKHIGTGFLIAKKLIATNLHVLQRIASQKKNASWNMNPNCTINFGEEFRAIENLNTRSLTKVIFTGAEPIVPDTIDHNKLDLAIIELNDVEDDYIPKSILAFDADPMWAQEGNSIYTIGYPANPGTDGLVNYGSDVLQLLFDSMYGYKRIAPGDIITSSGKQYVGRLVHDASTLGGNSGSLVVAVGREFAAAGIHYGGRSSIPRENWAHILGSQLDKPNGLSGLSLKSYLEDNGVKFVDRKSSIEL